MVRVLTRTILVISDFQSHLSSPQRRPGAAAARCSGEDKPGPTHMSNSTEYHKEYQGPLTTVICSGYAILLIHCYTYCQNVFGQVGVTLLDKIIAEINNRTHLFEQGGYAKVVALFFLLVYVFGNKSRKSTSATWYQAVLWGLIGLVLYFGSILLSSVPTISEPFISISYTLLAMGGYTVLIRAAGIAERIIDRNPKVDSLVLDSATKQPLN